MVINIIKNKIMGVQFVQSQVWLIQKLNKAEHTTYLKKKPTSSFLFSSGGQILR